MPLVSVIVSAYNAEAFIGECLDSIIAQTYKQLEIIVVDDGSTDKTAEIVQGYSQVRYIHQKPSGGPAAPRNNGLLHCSGEYICFFDCDDIMVENRIEKQVDFMQQHPEIGVSFCDYRNFNENGVEEQSHFQTCPELLKVIKTSGNSVISDARRILAQENFGICGTLMMKRDILKYSNGFDQNMKGAEDFYFYYKLTRYSHVGIINEVGQLRRLHGNNLSGNKYMMMAAIIRCRTVLKETETDLEAKKLLGTYISTCWSDFARLEANRRQYLTSLHYEIQALASDFSFFSLLKSLYNCARMALIAIGAHHPKEPVRQETA